MHGSMEVVRKFLANFLREAQPFYLKKARKGVPKSQKLLEGY
jgi:hypothetical protein